jgi:murein DD-endopeptidase MepM/ murein hydrolase activator NlpD
MKYKFNYKSLSFEVAKTTPLQWLRKILVHFATAVTFAAIVVVVWISFFESPKEKQLKREMRTYKTEVTTMRKQINLLSNVLKGFENKDDNLYRIILDAEPSNRELDKTALEEQYAVYAASSNSEMLNQLQINMDILTQRTQNQLNSYKELWKLAQEKDSILASIPAISPVKNPMVISGFGMRYHPVYKILKMHTGIDIIGKHGTPIYATADGVVIEQADGYSGYGIVVFINHGRGYKTAYAHLSKKTVKIGQKIKRGDVIGYMGSTGLSVGTHLHYEVFKKDEHVNPIHYFFGDLTPEEYNAILEKASEVNQSLS